MTDFLNSFRPSFKSIDLINLIAVLLSIILYFLSFLQPQNSMYIPFLSSFVNFPKGNGIITDNKSIGYFIIAYPFILFILKMVVKISHSENLNDLKYFSCLCISFTSLFLTMAISNFLSRFIGFPTPNFYSECGESQFSTCKKSTLIRFSLFKSYPSLEISYQMAILMNFAFTLKLFSSIFNPLYVILLGLGFHVGALRINSYQNHPTDVILSILIGFIVPYYLWNMKKSDLCNTCHHNMPKIYN